MAWTSNKNVRKRKMKRTPKIKWEASGLGAPASKSIVLIEEIRRQGMMLASRGVGEGVRSRQAGGQETSADRSAQAARRQRRGATG